MKKIFSLLITLCLSLMLQAQVSKTLNCTAGGLAAALTASEKSTITNLTLTGTIDARDFKTMRDSMTVLAVLDLNATSISYYYGNRGTLGSWDTDYPAGEVPESAFFYNGWNKTSLTSVILPSTVYKIGKYAFQKCSGLTSIVIPPSVGEIDEWSISECPNLTALNIPASVEYIHDDAFHFSGGWVTVDSKNGHYYSSDGVLFSGSTLMHCPVNKTGSLTLNTGITHINNDAFAKCNKLTSIQILGQLSSIGSYVFWDCTSLKSFIIPGSVSMIGYGAFTDCKSLKNLSIPSSVSTIKMGAFSGCDSLTSIIIPSGVTTLETDILKDCRGLKTATILTPIKVLDVGFFNGCTSLNSVSLPPTIKTICQYAFSDCSSLKSITLPPTLDSIYGAAFESCTVLKTISLPPGIKYIGNGAFRFCNGLTSIYAEPVTPISLPGSEVFWNVDKNTCTLYVPVGSKGAYQVANQWKDFKNIVEMKVLTLSSDHLNISAAGGVIDSVKITSNTTWTATSDQSWLTINPTTANGSPKLKITYAANPTYSSRQATIIFTAPETASKSIIVNQAPSILSLTITNTAGNLSSVITKEQRASIKNLILKGTIDARDFKTMRDSLPSLSTIDMSEATIVGYAGKLGTASSGNYSYNENRVPNCAFYNGTFSTSKNSLISIKLPSSVTSIGNRAFYECNGLTSMIIPSFVTEIDFDSFNDCFNLKTVDIPSLVETIGNGAFMNCQKLTSITLPSTVTSIGSLAFAGCESMTSFTVNLCSPINISNKQDVFFDSNVSNCTLYVPYGAKELYTKAAQWNNFKNIVEDSHGFNISSNVLNFDYSGGNDTLTLLANVDWTAVSDQSWLTISSNSGTGNDSLIIKAGANLVTTPRFATVSVSATGVVSQIIKIVQAPSVINLTVKAGNLASLLTAAQKRTLTTLKLVGTIDARDFLTMRDSIPNLKSIDLSDVSIVAYSGRYGTAGTDLTDYNANAIPLHAFWSYYYQNHIESVLLPSTVTSLEYQAFYNCTELTSINLPNTITSINDQAFYGCLSLNSIILPSSLTLIQDGVFSGCSELSSIVIPTTVTKIGNSAFDGCFKLSAISIPPGLTSIGDNAFYYCQMLSSLELPKLVSSIGKYAFSKCKLKSVTIPDSVTCLNGGVFKECDSLRSVTIPSTITSIGSEAFYGCKSLTSIRVNKTIPVNLGSSDEVFGNMYTNKCKLYVPFHSSVLYSAAYQWKDFKNIIEDGIGISLSCDTLNFGPTGGTDTILIQSNVSWQMSSDQPWLTVKNSSGTGSGKIIISAVSNGSSQLLNGKITVSSSGVPSQYVLVTQDPVPSTITNTAGHLSSILTWEQKYKFTHFKLTGTIDARDFKTMRDEMKSLSFVDLSDATIVGYTGTQGPASKNSTVYYENVVPRYSFCNPDNYYEGKTCLRTILLPKSAKSIDDHAFYNCSGLNSISISETVSTIRDNVFKGCSNISYIPIPKSITSIGNDAFNGCKSLITITLPSSISVIEAYLFESCHSLKSITIPSSVLKIYSFAFLDCKSLQSITIPSSVKIINQGAFESCYDLKSVTIPSSISNIESDLFAGCKSLTSISIPSSVTSIGSWAFDQCSSLKTITIPLSVKMIGSCAFMYCDSLISIKTFSSTPVDLRAFEKVFFYVDKSNCKLFVPYKSAKLYRVANQWKDFVNIIEMSRIDLSDTITNLLATGGNSNPILIMADIPWNTKSNQSWLKTNHANGSGNDSLVFTAEANPTFSERTAIVTISADSVVSQFITVTQKARDVVLNISSDRINIAALAGSTGSVVVTSNISWIVSSNQTWLTANKPTGNGNDSLIFTAKANPTISVRTAIVTIYAEGVDSQIVTVTQAAGDAFLTVSENKISMKAEGGTASEGVISNTSWTASSDKTWLTVNPLTGSEKDTLIFTAEANPTSSVRIATVTISAVGAEPQAITVTQSGRVANTTFKLEGVTLFPNPVTDGFRINGLNGKAILTVSDLSGKQIFSKEIDGNEYISANLLAKGIYIVRITNAEGKIEKKLVKE